MHKVMQHCIVECLLDQTRARMLQARPEPGCCRPNLEMFWTSCLQMSHTSPWFQYNNKGRSRKQLKTTIADLLCCPSAINAVSCHMTHVYNDCEYLIYSLAMPHDNQMLPLDCWFSGRFLRVVRIFYLGRSFLSCLYLSA